MSELKLYQPANGTEGMIFESRFCDLCIHDVDDACVLHANALLFDVSDKEYPREWTYDEEGNPVCMKFATEIEPATHAELEQAGQVSLPLTIQEQP